MIVFMIVIIKFFDVPIINLQTFPKLCLLQVWRWAFFLGCILPIYWISHLVVHCLVVAVESTLFTTKQVLYYTYGVRVSLQPP